MDFRLGLKVQGLNSLIYWGFSEGRKEACDSGFGAFGFKVSGLRRAPVVTFLLWAQG